MYTPKVRKNRLVKFRYIANGFIQMRNFFQTCRSAFALLMMPVLVNVCTIPCMAQKKVRKDKEGFVQIFDGKTFNQWRGDTAYWRIENGVLTGEIKPGKEIKTNSFIVWQGGALRNFELKLLCRITEDGNSGINYRSEIITAPPYAMRGYQADIDGKNKYTGQNYEERGRTTLAYRGQITTIRQPEHTGNLQDLIKNNAWINAVEMGRTGNDESEISHVKRDEWTEIHLVIKRNRLQHFVNGVLVSDVTDNDTVNRRMSGWLGVQVHVGPPMKVEFKEIRLKKLGIK